MAAHGTTTRYTSGGCRCDECRRAMTAAVMRWRQKHRLNGVPESVPHGTNSTYSNYGCRCEACRRAHTAYANRHNEQRRQMAACNERALTRLAARYPAVLAVLLQDELEKAGLAGREQQQGRAS